MTIWYQLRCGCCESLEINEEGRCKKCGKEAKKFEVSGIGDSSDLVQAVKKEFLSGKN
jgi:rRNA maturation endonuclease Nob1